MGSGEVGEWGVGSGAWGSKASGEVGKSGMGKWGSKGSGEVGKWGSGGVRGVGKWVGEWGRG